MYYDVVERFVSINGEGKKSGELAVFFRFANCNLSCPYCDTKWANVRDVHTEKMTEEDILAYIKNEKIYNVVLTGGEPLFRTGMRQLILYLLQNVDIHIEIETNGSIDLMEYINISPKVSLTMDYKLPSSKMEKSMCLKNLEILRKNDSVKFVVGDNGDLMRTKEIIDSYNLSGRVNVLISPIYSTIDLKEIVGFMKKNRLNGVALQIQLHKLVCDNETRGV